MKSLERRFNDMRRRHPEFTTYSCFAAAIKAQKFSGQVMRRWFQKLVSRDDYARTEKRAILAYLEGLSNPARTTGIEQNMPIGNEFGQETY